MSPLEARIGSFLYVFIFVISIILIILAVMHFVLLKFKKKYQSKEWLEKNKNRETKWNDVKELAREAGLTSIEAQRLWKICKRYKARNILVLYRDTDALNELFSTEYKRMIAKPTREEKIEIFFQIRYKLEKLHERKLTISSTKSLRKGQIVNFKTSTKATWNLRIEETNDISFSLHIPDEYDESEALPKPLSKVDLMFTLPTGFSYRTVSRLMRYERNLKNLFIAVMTHSQVIKMLQRRNTKRMNTDLECTFSAVKQKKTRKGKTEREISEKKVAGRLLDISADGCRLECALPILKGQMLQVTFSLPSIQNAKATGIIVFTQKEETEKKFVLHVKFTDINIATRNRIYADIYKY